MLILILISRYLKRKALIESNMYIAFLALTTIVIYYGIINQFYDIILSYMKISNVQNKYDFWVPGLMIVAITFAYYMTGLKIHIGRKVTVNGNYIDVKGSYINKVEKYEEGKN